MLIEAGTQLGPYEVLAPIGKGGMGEVYHARDTRLDREVAIKVLAEHLTKEAEFRQRFQREAKLLASLNHPNIASIHGFEDFGGHNFLVLEYVEGETLAARVKRGPLALDEALDVAIPVAEALAAAHKKGIIHRDLKPGNVMIGADGAVKILDFGLAKATSEDPSSVGDLRSPTTTVAYTRPGAVLGTPAYMSPEQVRGKPVDKRTDIWSFGSMLFECLTGRPLFAGESPSDMIGAILHKDPEWSLLPANTPQNIRRVLQRCLSKDLHNRLHDMADARIELQHVDPPSPGDPTSSRRYGLAFRLILFILLVILGLQIGSLLRSAPHVSSVVNENPLAGARFSRLTDFEGSEFDAAISPDGLFVTFISDRDGSQDLFLSQVDTAEITNLARTRPGSQVGANAKAPVRTVGFNGDGTEIWFRGALEQERLRATPLLGSSVRNLLGPDVVNLAWSPDGGRLVYHTGKTCPGDPLYVSDPDGANSQLILTSPGGMHQHYPAWSVDAQWIYLVRGYPPLEMNLWRVRPDGSEAEQLTTEKLDVRYPTPIDQSTVLYCALEDDGAGPWLWALNVETKVSRRASIGMEQYSSVSASADGRRLVATLQTRRAALWTVPILDHVAGDHDVQPLPGVSTNRAFAPRVRGSYLFYLSSRGSGDGLWRYHDGKSKEIWRGSATPLLEPVAVSPQDGSIALVLRRDSQRRLHKLSADGAQREPLAADVDVRGAPTWSPDGRWIVIGGKRAGVSGLFRIPVDGGPLTQLETGVASNPVWSPRDDLIVYSGAEIGAMAPLRAIRPDGSPVEFPTIEVRALGERMRFLPDGSGLVYMQGESPSQDFWILDMDTMKPRRLTELKPGTTMRTFDVSPDASHIIFDRMTEESDIVLIER